MEVVEILRDTKTVALYSRVTVFVGGSSVEAVQGHSDPSANVENSRLLV
jgi:hypothetical protein